MNDENNTNGPTTPPEPPQARAFDQERWLILVGLRQREEGDPRVAHPFPNDITLGMAITPEAVVPTAAGDRPDKSIPSVHFAQWLDRNWPVLFRLWEVEYAQYMNLARRSEVGKPPALRLVGSDGERLQ
jgi:hypothetical protein